MPLNPKLDQPIAIGRTAEVYAWQEGQVLKVFRDWVSINTINHELRISRLVQATGLPVPAVLGDVVEVDGRRGICYERVEGVSMLVLIASHPLTMAKNMRLLGKLHAEMHSRQETALPSQRQILQEKIRTAEPLPDDLKQAALQRLNKLPGGDRVCHGDFHPGNVLVTSKGPVVIDWIDSSSGNPLADVARTLVLVSAASVPLNTFFGWYLKFFRKIFLSAYMHGYNQTSLFYQEQLKAWIPVVAAARLNEEISSENEHLLGIVRKGLT